MKDKTLGDTKKIGTSEKKVFSHDQLFSVFREVEDTMERCNVPVFLVDETAKQAKENEDLTGDTITWGMKANELNPFVISTLKQFHPDVQIYEDAFCYNNGDIKVIVKLYHNKNQVFNNPDTINYRVGTYKIPNPFDKFYKARFILK